MTTITPEEAALVRDLLILWDEVYDGNILAIQAQHERCGDHSYTIFDSLAEKVGKEKE